MKRRARIISVILGAVSLTLLAVQEPVYANSSLEIARERGVQLEDQYQPKGSIITEMNTGQILWQENPQIVWPPASMTKLMTVLLAYDAVEQGKFTLDTQVPVSEKYVEIAGRYALSNNNMRMGASYTISELIDLVIVPSSAAATYMLADLIEPDPDKFVEMMNRRAKELGMARTEYYNCVGVRSSLLEPYQPVNIPQDGDNKTSPEDYALLCTYFVREYPDILNHTKNPEIVVKPGTPYEERFTTYQFSVEGAKYGLKGTDGLKTGSSGTAGFNYASTAKRGDTRLVELVMGVSHWDDQSGEEKRHLVGNAIMERAFEQYEYRKVLPKGKHTIDGQEIVTKQDFWDCVPKEEAEVPLKIEQDKVLVDAERSYLPGYEPPFVTCAKAEVLEKDMEKGKTNAGTRAVKVIAGMGVLTAAVLTWANVYVGYRRKQRRRRKRRKR